MRLGNLNGIKNGRTCALKTANRRLTHNAVSQITHSGAPEIINGMAANCELPANTIKVMALTSTKLIPELASATPVVIPHAPMPGDAGNISRTPAIKSGCRTHCNKACRGVIAHPFALAGQSAAGPKMGILLKSHSQTKAYHPG